MPKPRTALIWTGLLAALAVPLAFAATSPLLQYRQPVYILAGFAGIAGMGLLLLQPLLASRLLPGLTANQHRKAHRAVGAALVVAIGVHVAGLWITSPPDMIDALTFTAPTLFSPLGVIAMWAIFATAAIALARRRLGLAAWRLWHGSLAAIIALSSTAHALLIEGTMETVTKAALCLLVVLAAANTLSDLRARHRQQRLTRRQE